jgi:pimeloyl-ACP methyl ester carboxylesterase
MKRKACMKKIGLGSGCRRWSASLEITLLAGVLCSGPEALPQSLPVEEVILEISSPIENGFYQLPTQVRLMGIGPGWTSYTGSNGGLERGLPLFSQEVEPGAIFFPFDFADGFPFSLIGGCNFFNRPGRSNFIAIKDNKVWISASRGCQTTQLNWEHQIRYYSGPCNSPGDGFLKIGAVPNSGFFTENLTASLFSVSFKVAGLRIESVKLEERSVEDLEWRELVGGKTVDGNQVRLSVEIANSLPEAQTARVRVETEDGQCLQGVDSEFRDFPPGVTDLEWIWDTTGYAWLYDTGNPGLDRLRVTIDTMEFACVKSLSDQKFVDVKVVPRPVILVHGWNSSFTTWGGAQGRFAEHHPDWQTFSIGDPGGLLSSIRLETGTFWSKPEPLGTSVAKLALYVSEVRASMNAWHVDLLGHSYGGLICRRYIGERMVLTPENRAVVSHLVMLGTPNEGTHCATVLIAISMTLGTMHLTPTFVNGSEMNALFSDQRGVSFCLIAGDTSLGHCLVGLQRTTDGVVSVESAFGDSLGLFGSDTSKLVRNVWHKAMTGSVELTGLAAEFFGNPPPSLLCEGLPLPLRRVQAPAAAAGVPEAEEAFDPQIVFNRTFDLQPGVEIAVEFGFPEAEIGGLSMACGASITSTLRRPDGLPVWTVASGSEEAQTFFRSFQIAGNPGGRWSVSLRQDGPEAELVELSALVSGAPEELAFHVDVPRPGGLIDLRGSLNREGIALPDTQITVDIAGPEDFKTTVSLVDDGLHGDDGAVDGILGATLSIPAPGLHVLVVRALSGDISRITTRAVYFTETLGVSFLRGDTNDDGNLDISDPVRILLVLFSGNPTGCEKAGDANDSGNVEITDAIVLLDYLFRGGPLPHPSILQCSTDATADALSCESHGGCP